MSEFVLLRPWWLLALIPMAVLLWLLQRARQSNGAWESVIDPALAEHVLEPQHASARRKWLPWLALAWLLAIVVLVGPSWESQSMPVYQGQDAHVVVLDLSQSMDADDIKPSRLQRARFKLTDILQRSQGMQVGLIIFSEVPYVVSPLTDDIATLEAFLPALTTSVIPVQGGQLAPALQRAKSLLEQAGVSAASITLITDSHADSEAMSAAAELKSAGFRLSILGVGTRQGAPIKREDGSFLESQSGEIILPVLDEAGLRALAARAGGLYQTLVDSDADLDALSANQKLSGNVTEESDQNRQTENWIERGPWLLFPLLALGLMLFRRGAL